mmetsp:Transcript_29174/g.70418  ORF Transcript_29174/g.70418 Transcript_29174/m.70418 type:complete len:512 (-) Transcript_29174:299-1834(-)
MTKMRPQQSNSRLVFYIFFVISILTCNQRLQPTIFPAANALSSPSPSSLKLNAKGQPRLCSIIEGSLNGFTRLCFGKAAQKDIQVQALSNRKVLQGKLESLQVSIEKSKSSLLAFDSVTVNGSNLNFGYLPVAIAVGLPSLFWFISIRAILYLAFLSFIWRNQREYLFSPERIKAMEQRMDSQKQRITKFLLGGDDSACCCRLKYTISMTNDSLQNSPWVQVLARSLLQTFMANSALPLAAAVSDATNNLMLLEESSSSTTKSSSSSGSNSNLRNANGGLTLSSQRNNNQNKDNNPILAQWKEQEEEQRNKNQNQQGPSFPLTELFAATSFKLRQAPIFAKDGHIWLPCVANLPDSSKSQLEFTLRTKPKVASSFRQEHGLEFSAAECSLDVDAAISDSGASTPDWAKQFLPSIVWLPIGSAGMILPIATGTAAGGNNNNKRHQIKQLRVQEDLCRIKGELDLFPKRNTNSDEGEGIIGKAFGNLLQSFTTSTKRRKTGDNDRPKLPGGGE